MQKERKFFSVFIAFFILSAIIFGLSRTPIFSGPSSLVSSIFSPIQAGFLHFAIGVSGTNISNIDQLEKLTNFEKLQKQNKSLLDQFQSSGPGTQNLLPAQVIGAPSFIPGLSEPEFLIINKGLNQGLKKGQAVVFKNNLVGKIDKISLNNSQVQLITNNKFSQTANTGGEKIISGVLKGQGSGEMILDNILLSENLKNGDFVFTKGDVNLNGEGVPPDLIVGKIISVEKNPSALFQKAQVKELIDLSKLSTVFIVIN